MTTHPINPGTWIIAAEVNDSEYYVKVLDLSAHSEEFSIDFQGLADNATSFNSNPLAEQEMIRVQKKTSKRLKVIPFNP